MRKAKHAASTKEMQKNAKYARVITETQLHFILVAITTFVPFGPANKQKKNS